MQRFGSLQTQIEKRVMKTGFIILLLTLLLSCKKESANGDVYVYSQTQCSDKWANGDTDAKTIANMLSYLSSKGIVVANAVLTDGPVDRFYCMACTCPTGRSFLITVSKATVADLEKEGFYKAD